jgi:nucleoside permease NupC
MVNSMLFGEVMKQHESSKHSKGIPIVIDFKKNETKKLWFFEVDEEIVFVEGLVKILEYVNVCGISKDSISI